MSKDELENLARIGQLKKELPSRAEFEGLVTSARKRLSDARRTSLAPESRFDLAYNAAHAFALAALRWHGYRSESRYIVFQALGHTADLEPRIWRVFAKCHEKRNLAEYEGSYDVDAQLLKDLIDCTARLEAVVSSLRPPDEE